MLIWYVIAKLYTYCGIDEEFLQFLLKGEYYRKRKTNLWLAKATHVTRSTVAVEVVDQLNAVLRPIRWTWIGQALIDISLATRTHEPGWTFTFESSNFINACAIIMTRGRRTVVNIDITDFSQCSCIQNPNIYYTAHLTLIRTNLSIFWDKV